MLKIFCRHLATQPRVRDKIVKKLETKFGTNLIAAKVNNLSWKHDEPKDSEKYLEVIVVTTEFEGMLKSKRNDLIKNLLKEETNDCQVTYQLLTPSKWYDSNLRGLKLDEIYSDAPVCDGKLKEIAEKFYSKPNSE